MSPKQPGPGAQSAREASDFVPVDEAAERLGLEGAGWREALRSFPMRWPRPYLELAASPAGAAIRRMGAPDEAELGADPGDLADPVGEAACSPHPFVVQKHADRAILVVTARCHFYCRFCFRRAFPGGEHRDPARRELDSAIAFLKAQEGMDEVILSGGDPLVLADERLREIIAVLSTGERPQRLRVHTRAPVHHPARVTAELAAILASGRPCRVVTHFNHPVELTPAARAAVALLQDAGLPVLNQAVLLAGVNDDVATLANLWRGVAAFGMQAYYLHHPDRVPGNARFRVSIPRALELQAALAQALEPHLLPQHVIDLPDGSGKIPVAALTPLGANRWRAPHGLEFADVPQPA